MRTQKTIQELARLLAHTMIHDRARCCDAKSLSEIRPPLTEPACRACTQMLPRGVARWRHHAPRRGLTHEMGLGASRLAPHTPNSHQDAQNHKHGPRHRQPATSVPTSPKVAARRRPRPHATHQIPMLRDASGKKQLQTLCFAIRSGRGSPSALVSQIMNHCLSHDSDNESLAEHQLV